MITSPKVIKNRDNKTGERKSKTKQHPNTIHKYGKMQLPTRPKITDGTRHYMAK
jgi:hypothetical protein